MSFNANMRSLSCVSFSAAGLIGRTIEDKNLDQKLASVKIMFSIVTEFQG